MAQIRIANISEHTLKDLKELSDLTGLSVQELCRQFLEKGVADTKKNLNK